MQKYDLVILGAGPGGYVAAIRAAQLGAKVALIEKDKVGGACLNRGCIPTKAILSCINLYRQMKQAEEFGISTGEIIINFKKVIARKNRIVNRLSKGIEFLLKKNGIDLILGEGRVLENNRIEIILADGRKQLAVCRKLILATGSSPRCLPGLNFDNEKFFSSDQALELEELPKEIIIVGGGVIGIHFAAIYRALGIKVTIYEALPEILPGLDEDLVQTLHKILEKQGVKIFTQTKFDPSVAAEKNLICVGRIPNLSGIEKVGLKIEKGKVRVNEKMETDIEGVYAIGDLTGINMLAHVAYEQGIVAAENALGGNSTMDYSAIPLALYTHPEIGSVGLTEKEAVNRKSLAVSRGRFPFTALGIAQAEGETEGFIKILSDEKTGKVLGAHIIGPHATDLLGIATLAIKQGLTIEQLSKTLQAHPTFPEGFYEAALSVAKKSLHFIN